ncbi:hypothetical protein GALL_551500 [mine drainage metagenome]|uniref:Uncharacterized protein n=1 Tax=mine drainage metagenome TaxID=410659 RepID=A0A1J5NX29_9ZZZZ
MRRFADDVTVLPVAADHAGRDDFGGGVDHAADDVARV